jgi:hypothetical protein
MPRFIVDKDEKTSLESSAIIHERAGAVYSQAGYTVDEKGHIVGVNADSGKPDPNAQKTERYAIPEQRLDGKWVIPHPEQMPAAGYVVDEETGLTLVEHIMAGFVDPVIEEYDPSWFPPPELPVMP